MSLPSLSVTAPDGSQRPVVIFGFPAAEEELAPLWQFFNDETVAPAPAPEPTPEPAPAFDVDNATLDKIEAYWSQRREAANEEAKQAFDDEAYLALSDVVSDFKTMRVPPQDYVRFKCRLCTTTLGSQNALRRHLGRVPQPRGRGCVIICSDYHKLVRERTASKKQRSMTDWLVPPKKKQKLE